MAGFVDRRIFCEGVAGGHDVILLEAARISLLSTYPLAEDIDVRPAGSKANLGPLIQTFKDAPSAFGIRDRDFLPRQIVAQQRAKSLRPYPLSRHCIESYLLDTVTFTAATGVRAEDFEAARDAEAELRIWRDASQGTLDQFVARHRLNPGLGIGIPSDQDSAISQIETALNVFSAEIDHRLASFDVAAELSALVTDFKDDGPLWTRVDGKALLFAIRKRLDPHGRLGERKAFVRRLVTRAERHPPPALRADLAALLETMQRR